MAGLAKSLPDAWKDLVKHLDLDPPTDLHGAVYLGQSQFDVQVDEKLVREQKHRWDTLFCDVRVGEYDASKGNLTA